MKYAGWIALALLCGCGARGPEVVAYVSLDEMYARPILEAFEREQGVHVRAVYDTEASKTTGLVTRLLAERERPRADVFWNNEVAQTIVLGRAGVLAAYDSPQAKRFPAAYRDAQGLWTGFGARARVLVYNKRLVPTPPRSIHDLAKPEWRGRAAMAMPLFGTTATHAAALWAALGPEKAAAFFTALKDNQVAFLPGNGAVCDRVAAGEYAFGLTDTDDVHGAMLDGRDVEFVLPDQEPGGLGTLLLPNSVALIAGAPHAEAAKQLIDYLLSATVEARLASARSSQIPLGAGVDRPEGVIDPAAVRTMPVGFADIAAQMDAATRWVREHLLT